MIEFWNNEIWPFLLAEQNREAVGTIIAVLGVVGAVWLYLTGRLGALVAWVFRKKAEDGKEDEASEKLTVDSFIAIQAKLRAELQAELAGAHADEREQLLARIEQLNQRMANPEPALAEAQARIADLEDILRREGNEIGAERLNEAIGALEAGDFSYADDIFAEIEEREKLAVQRAARAAYGRGEVAEAQVRWADAAAHYTRSLELDETLPALMKAHEFTHWAGNFEKAHGLGNRMLDHANDLADLAPTDKAQVLNNFGVTLNAMGRYAEAELLYREALEIRRSALGADHPDTAQSLNNLAALLQATGRFEEAEPLYREALEIRRSALGAAHPGTATSLNNLAALLQATGRFEEAEPLYREALEITRSALGADHPSTATRLNNLALLLYQTDRRAEAIPMMQEALAIREATLGPDHPDTQASRASLERMEAHAPSP